MHHWICCQFSPLNRSLRGSMFYPYGPLPGAQRMLSFCIHEYTWVSEFHHLITRKCEFWICLVDELPICMRVPYLFAIWTPVFFYFLSNPLFTEWDNQSQLQWYIILISKIVVLLWWSFYNNCCGTTWIIGSLLSIFQGIFKSRSWSYLILVYETDNLSNIVKQDGAVEFCWISLQERLSSSHCLATEFSTWYM